MKTKIMNGSRLIAMATVMLSLSAWSQTTYDSSTLVDTNNTSTSTSTVNSNNTSTTNNTSTSASTVNSTSSNVNTNNNINSGTQTMNNNNVNTGTMTYNNNNVNTSTSSNVNTNNNINSGTMTYNNNNVNTSTSANTNVNTNNNVNTGDMTNRNINTTTSNNANTNVNSSTAVNQNIQSGDMTNRNINDTNITQRVIQPPPTAVAPAMMSGGNSDLCSTGTSGSVQTQVFGVSSGGTVRDLNCERLKLSKTLYDMGMKVAAVATMCQDRRVFDAMMAAGTPCPYEGKIGEQARAAWQANPDKIPSPDKVKLDENYKKVGIGAVLGILVHKLF
jgi:hypothetical protein